VTRTCPGCGDLHSSVTADTLTPTEAPALCARCQPVTDAQADALAAWEASVRRAVAEDRAAQGRATEDDRETMH
jgi:transcription elongation factor Elf1